MKQFLSLGIILLLTTSVFAQSSQEKARELMGEAISLMENGDTEKSRELLEEAKQLDPDNPLYDYEIAFSYSIDKDYKSVIKVCKKLTKHKKQFPEFYQMLGNAYDYDGNPKKAIAAYENGLKLFPNAGNLYLERGNMELVQENYNEALDYYIEGTLRDPDHSSNYYWCAKIYLSSENEYLGMIYGELFMNLERSSQRTVEISQLLYNTYQSEITIQDTSASVSFASNKMEISVSGDDTEESANQLLEQLLSVSYGNMVYEMVLVLSIIGEDEVDMASLNRIRTKFRNTYYEQEKHEEYPKSNALFDYQKTVEEAGYMEAYNYWVLSQGNEEEFTSWVEENVDAWESFIEWFTDNGINLNEANKFVQP